MFKRDDLRSRFRIFLTGCRLFATIKILVILLVTNLTSNTKNYFFNSMFNTKNDFFSNSVFSTKISDIAQSYY